MRTRFFLLFGLFALIVSAETELKPAPEGLTADAILKSHIEKTGGADAYAKQESMIMKATMVMEAQKLQAAVTVYAKAPDKLMVHQNVANMMEMRQGYDGKVGWESNPITGLHELTGKELENLKLTATFNYQAKWADTFSKRELLGIQEIAGRPAYVLEMTPDKASPMTFFIDTETYEMVRSDSTQISSMGEMKTQSYFSDFKTVEGVHTPMKVTQQTPMGVAVLKIEDIQVNVPVDDALFAKPAAAPKIPVPTQK